MTRPHRPQAGEGTPTLPPNMGSAGKVHRIQVEVETLHATFRAVGLSDEFFAAILEAHKAEMVRNTRAGWDWTQRSMRALVGQAP